MQITLLSGQTIDTGDVLFNPERLAAQQTPIFTYIPTGDNLDNLLKFSDMASFDGFDAQAWNRYRAANPVIAGSQPVSGTDLETNVVSIWSGYVANEPLRAPLNALLGRPLNADQPTAKDVIFSPVGAVGGLLVLFLLVKLVD